MHSVLTVSLATVLAACGGAPATSRSTATSSARVLAPTPASAIDPAPTIDEPAALDAPLAALELVLGSVFVRPSEALLDEAIKQRIFAVYARRLARCYDDEDVVDRNAVMLQFSITTTGGVANPKAHSRAAANQPCLEARLASWTFPIPRDQVGAPIEVKVAFSFAVATSPP